MPVPSKNRRWLWFFGVLVILAVAAVTIPIVYNLRQQLKPGELERAMALWKEHGPSSYNLRYTVKKPNSEEEYHAEIRSGRVRAAYVNGRLLSPRMWEYHDMPSLFQNIKGFLNEDAKPGKPRVFTTAQFSADDGRLKRYVRSVTATREHVVIEVKEFMPVENDRKSP